MASKYKYAESLAIITKDAFSYDRYGKTQWLNIAKFLERQGLNTTEAEWVLRSKWMRWAGDQAYIEPPNAIDFAAWFTKSGGINEVRKTIRTEG